MKTIADLTDQWLTAAEFARDIGLKPSHAGVFKIRGSIPVEHWPAIIKAAADRGIEGVTAESLMALHTDASIAVAG